MKLRFSICLWLFCIGSVVSASDPLPQKVEAFLVPRRQNVEAGESKPEVIIQILTRPDPGTFFLRYAFGMKQHAKKLLSTEQATQLDAVIEKHKTAQHR